jgi:hypothetical protein
MVEFSENSKKIIEFRVISQVNPQYFKFKQFNKCIHKFLKIIRDSKVDGKIVGYIMVIEMNGNIELKIEIVYKMHSLSAERSRLQIKRIEDGIGLLQNEATYLEASMKITHSD